MSYRSEQGWICDGCGASVIENDPAVTEVRITSECRPGITSVVEVCRGCVAAERTKGTLLGRFLSSKPFYGDGEPS